MEEQKGIIRGVANDSNVVKFAVLGVPDKPGVAFKIFSALAANSIDVDMIVQSIRSDNKEMQDIVFTVALNDKDKTRALLDKIGSELDMLGILTDESVAKVSIVGACMQGSPGIAAKMFGALAAANVNIQVISTSEISISCLIDAGQVREAVNSIHNTFFSADQI